MNCQMASRGVTFNFNIPTGGGGGGGGVMFKLFQIKSFKIFLRSLNFL